MDLAMNKNFQSYKSHLAMHDAYTKDNMANISQTIPIDISNKLDVIENIFIRADFTPEEIKIYTTIFKKYHDIFAWSYE